MKLELISLDRQKPPITLQQFPVIVGLDRGADVCLDDSSIGHYQCMIDDAEGVLTVWDLGTKAGTFINGQRIVQKAPLMPGDELAMGKTRFVAQYENGAAKSKHARHDAAGSPRYSAPAPAHCRRPTAPV
jgi:pSer/pThr/pTyr-binding forkhead associated (FHA) protein